jgi:hypothetical protein
MGVGIEELRRSVEAQHGGDATYVRSVPVTQTLQDKTVWAGAVQVFDLAGHPQATRAYAWSTAIKGSTERRFFAVLDSSAVRSPADAVRAATGTDPKERQSP